MGDGGMAGQGSGRMEEGLQAARPGKQSLYTLCSGTVGSCPRAYIMLPPSSDISKALLVGEGGRNHS